MSIVKDIYVGFGRGLMEGMIICREGLRKILRRRCYLSSDRKDSWVFFMNLKVGVL